MNTDNRCKAKDFQKKNSLNSFGCDQTFYSILVELDIEYMKGSGINEQRN